MTTANDGPLYLLAVIRPRMEVAAQAEAQLRVMMDATRAEPGNIHMDLVISDTEPDTWLMFEKFRSRPDWDDHMRTDHVKAGNEILGELLREPTELRFYVDK